MSYQSESEMYPAVVEWLNRFLAQKFRNAKILVADTSRVALNNFIARQNLQSFFPQEWVTYDLHVDVTGIIITHQRAELVFVECKLPALTLANVSQLLGYSRIALPLFSFLISPVGYNDSVISLIKTYARSDILEYHWEKGKTARSLMLATWNERAKQIEPSTLLPNHAISIFGSKI